MVDGVVDGRYAGEMGRVLVVYHLQRVVQLEARPQDQLRADADAVVHHRGHGQHVKQRHHAEDPLRRVAQLRIP